MPRILNRFRKDRTDGASSVQVTLSDPSNALSTTSPNRNGAESPAQVTTSIPFRQAAKIGLFELGLGKGDAEKIVDVIAVHGLQGDAYKTWTHENGTMWLESILPDTIPFARIMTYGYNSTIAFSSSAADLEDKSMELINRLSMKRSSSNNESTRPIVFICHNLGGILVKKALIFAHEHSSDTHYKNILDSTRAIAFFGVPHRGVHAAWWFSFVASALKSSTLGASTHTAFVKDLQNNSPLLATISKQFIDRGKALKIYTFFETRKVFGTVVVDKESALLNLPNEKPFPVDANHRTICHIPSAESQEYEAVGAWIAELARSISTSTSLDMLHKTPAKSYFEVPNRRVSLFFGREDIISRIKHAFSAGSGPRVAVIQGMGGQGKSQVAMEYCRQSKDRSFSSIFWIDGTSESAVKRTFISISELISCPTDHLPSDDARIAYVCRKFTDWPTGLLLVFDNYDDPEDFPNIQDFFPRNVLAAILVTGRHADIGILVLGREANLIELPGLEEDAAVDLLEHHSQVKETTTTRGEEIVKRLGYHPLAITQAGAYIKKGGIRLDEFLDIYDQKKKEILNNTPQLSQYRRTLKYAEKETSLNVFTTWQLSFQQLMSYMPKDSAAGKLLGLLAFFNNKDISEWIFIDYLANHSDSETLKLLEWINRYKDSQSNWNSRLFKKDLVLLKDFCLLQLSTQEQDEYIHVSLHPLVQDWIRLQMDKTAGQEYTLMAADILGERLAMFRKDFYFGLPLDSKQYLLLHVIAQEENYREYLAKNYAELNQELAEDYRFNQLLFSVFLDMLGLYKNAELVDIRDMETNKRVLGEEHPATLTSMYNLSSTYWSQGRYKEAGELEERVVETRKRVLGEEHPDTLDSIHNLASTYLSQGRHKDAEALQVQVYETRKRVFDEEHPGTLAIMHNLASTYWSQERFKEAEMLQVRILETRKRVLGKEHPDTLSTVHGLASTYWSQERFKEAEALEVQVIERRKRVLGDEHLDALATMHSLALTYLSQGRHKEAETLHLQVYETRKRMLGKEHPDTLSTMHGLASTYWSQERFKEAEALHLQVYETRKRVLGDEHPKTLSTMNSLAVTYCSQERFKEAEALHLQVYETRKRVLGDEHPDTLSTMNSLAVTYWSQGRHKEAEALQVQVIERRNRVLGKEHPDTLLSMSNLAHTFMDTNRREEAIKLMEKVVKLRLKVRGADHPDTVDSKEILMEWTST